ncbi:hypothetical protein ABK040_007961 [Willaertia magna]
MKPTSKCNNIAIEYWSVQEVSMYIQEIAFDLIDMSVIASLFEYHCLSGVDLLEITHSDIKELLLTEVNVKVKTNGNETVKDSKKKVLKTVAMTDYLKQVLKDNSVTIDYLVYLIHSCLINHLKSSGLII